MVTAGAMGLGTLTTFILYSQRLFEPLGETGAVNASVRAGADACERVGDGLVAAHIISL